MHFSLQVAFASPAAKINCHPIRVVGNCTSPMVMTSLFLETSMRPNPLLPQPVLQVCCSKPGCRIMIASTGVRGY